MASTLGERIQQTLDARNMTRKELSKRTGLTEAAISRYITNKREPKMITLSNIARALNVSLSELLDVPCDNPAELDGAVQLVARSAKEITPEQKKKLIEALVGY